MQIQGLASRLSLAKRVVLILLVVLATYLLRSVVSALLQSVLLGALIASLLCPLSKFIERFIKRPYAVLLSIVLLWGLLLSFLLVLVPPLLVQVRALAERLPMAAAELQKVADFISLHFHVDADKLVQGVYQSLSGLGSGLLSFAAAQAGNVISFASTFFFSLVLAYYFLRDRESFLFRISLLIPLKYRKKCLQACAQMRRELSLYLRAQAVVSGVVAVMTAVGLFFVGVPYYLLLGLLMAVFDIIPYFGPFIGTLPILLFSVDRGIYGMIWATVVVIIIQQLEANFIGPRVMGSSTGLHPVIVMLSLVAGSILFGVWGMLLAVPTSLCLRGMWRVLRYYPL